LFTTDERTIFIFYLAHLLTLWYTIETLWSCIVVSSRSTGATLGPAGVKEESHSLLIMVDTQVAVPVPRTQPEYFSTLCFPPK
jgi:hypothetical protein